MAQIIKTQLPAKPATLPATTKKALSLANINNVLVGCTPYTDDEPCKPSMIRGNKGSALAAVGGKVSGESFTQGLTYLIAAMAYGQAKVEVIVQGLPSYSAHALRHGADLIKVGRGITTAELRRIVASAIESTLALPAPTRAKLTESSNKPAIDGECRTITTSRLEVPAPWNGDDGAIGTDADGELTANYENARIDAANAAAAKAAADAAAKLEADKEAREASYRAYIDRIKAEGQETRLRVIALCELASSLGIKLTAGQLRQLDKLDMAAKEGAA